MRLTKKDIGKEITITWSDYPNEKAIYLGEDPKGFSGPFVFLLKERLMEDLDDWSQIIKVGKKIF